MSASCPEAFFAQITSLFASNRNRWRAQRRAFRSREKDSDAQDAKREKEQLAEIQKQSDAFLANQADMFASLSKSTTSTGAGKSGVKEEEGTSSGGPIKLADKSKVRLRGDNTDRKAKTGAFGADEEEEAGRQKRPLIPLDYSGLEEGEDAGLTEEQIADRRKKRVQELVASIPTEKPGLWSWTVDWAYLSAVSSSHGGIASNKQLMMLYVALSGHAQSEDATFCRQKGG